MIHGLDCTIFLDEIQNEPDDSTSGRKKRLSRGGSCLLGREKAWAMVVDGSLERRKRRSAQCDAVCAIWKKVYICRRIGEIDDASIR